MPTNTLGIDREEMFDYEGSESMSTQRKCKGTDSLWVATLSCKDTSCSGDEGLKCCSGIPDSLWASEQLIKLLPFYAWDEQQFHGEREVQPRSTEGRVCRTDPPPPGALPWQKRTDWLILSLHQNLFLDLVMSRHRISLTLLLLIPHINSSTTFWKETLLGHFLWGSQKRRVG